MINLNSDLRHITVKFLLQSQMPKALTEKRSGPAIGINQRHDLEWME
jgi:hypothetical protein